MIELDLDLEDESEKSFLVSDGKNACWIPKSLVEYDTETGKFSMPEWLALERGLI